MSVPRPHRAELFGKCGDRLFSVLRVENGGIELFLLRISGVEEGLPLVRDERNVAVFVDRGVVLGDGVLVLGCQLVSGVSIMLQCILKYGIIF